MRGRFNFALMVAGVLGASLAPVSYGQVVDYSLGNIRTYEQVSDNVQPSVVGGYWSGMYIQTEVDTNASSVEVVGFGGGPRFLNVTDGGAGWELDIDWLDEADMDANAVAGPYTFTVSGGLLDNVSQTLNFVGSNPGSFPVVPYLTGSSLSELQSYNYTQPFTAQFNSMGSADFGEVIIERVSDGEEVLYDEFDSPITSYQISGGMLAPNTQYNLSLDYVNATTLTTGTAGGFGVNAEGFGGWVSSTEMSFHTNGVVAFDVMNRRIFDQGNNDEQPVAPSGWATHGYLDTVYHGDAGSVSVTGPGLGAGIGTSLTKNVEYPEWDFYVDHGNESVFGENSFYEFTVGGGDLGTKVQEIEMVGGTYSFPNTPYLVGDSYENLQLLNPDLPHTIYFNGMNNGSSIEVNMSPSGGDDEFELDLESFETSFVIPAGALTPNTNYEFELGFNNVLNTISDGSSPNFDGAPGQSGWQSSTRVSFMTGDLDTLLSDVVEFGMGNFQSFVQTTADVQPTVVAEYATGFDLRTGLNTDATMVQVTGSLGVVDLEKEEAEFPDWEADVIHADANGLATEGTYTFSVDGGNLGYLEQSIQVKGTKESSFPNTPYLTGTSFSDLQEMDVSQEITLNINSISNGDFTEVEIDPINTEGRYFDFDSDVPTNAITIPAGSLSPNRDYELEIGFVNETNYISGGQTPGFNGAEGFSGWVSGTQVLFHTEAQVVDVEVSYNRGYFQGENDVQPDTVEDYDFNGVVSTTSSAHAATIELSGPGLGASPLIDDGTSEWEFSVSALDFGSLPQTGVYTFAMSGGTLGDKSQEVVLSGHESFSFPNVPFFTGETYNNLQNMNPATPLEVTFNQMFGGTIIEGEIEAILAGMNFDFELDSSATSIIIPADSLSANTEYEFYLDFLNDEIAFITDPDGFDGAESLSTWSSYTVLEFTTGDAVAEASGIIEYGLGNTRVTEQLVGGVEPGNPIYKSGAYVEAESRYDAVTIKIEGLTSGDVFIEQEGIDAEWFGDVEHADLAAMLAEAPAGEYKFTVVGGTLDGLSQTIDFSGDETDFPNTPYVTEATFENMQEMNYRQDLTVEFNAMNSKGDFIESDIDPTGESGKFYYSGDIASDATSFVVPAGSLSPNTEYSFALLFENATSETTGDAGSFEGAEGFTGWVSETEITFHTNGVVGFEIAHVQGFEQTENDTVPGVADYFGTEGYLDTVYDGDTGGVYIFGRSVDEALEKEAFEPAWELDIEHADASAFGDGEIYEFSISGGDLGDMSQSIELSGDASYFPNTPFVTFDTYERLQVIDPTEDFVVNFNDMFGGSWIEVDLESLSTPEYLELELSMYETSFTIPANTLAEGATYELDLSFINDVNQIDGIASDGFDGAPGNAAWISMTSISFTTAGGSMLLGDVNGDGEITDEDVTDMSEGLLAYTLTDPPDLTLDLNENGTVDGDDGVFLVRNILGFNNSDFNYDGKVNIADLIRWAQHFGSTTPEFSDGDANFNGLVNIEDLITWAQQFGSERPTPTVPGPLLGVSSNAVAVPEPGSLTLIGLGAMCLARRRRRDA